MSNLEFGLNMTVVGMGGTLLILYVISLCIDLMIKILPHLEKESESAK